MGRKLHPTQEKLLELLATHVNDPLTYRELQEVLDISSTSVVAYHLKQLEKKGYLKRNPANPRDYHVLIDEPEKPVVYLNLYGLAYCGPEGNILDGNPVDCIPIPTRLLPFPSYDAFLVEAKGNSMAPKIKEGDIVIAKRTDVVDSGKIVVCVNDGEALIKKFQRGKQKVILVSTNSDYPPFLAADDFRIVGEVTGVFSQNFD
jgi:repressor LexA